MEPSRIAMPAGPSGPLPWQGAPRMDDMDASAHDALPAPAVDQDFEEYFFE